MRVRSRATVWSAAERDEREETERPRAQQGNPSNRTVGGVSEVKREEHPDEGIYARGESAEEPASSIEEPERDREKRRQELLQGSLLFLPSKETRAQRCRYERERCSTDSPSSGAFAGCFLCSWSGLSAVTLLAHRFCSLGAALRRRCGSLARSLELCTVKEGGVSSRESFTIDCVDYLICSLVGLRLGC